MRMSEKGLEVFHKIQDLYVEANLTADDGCCCAADFFVWASMTPFVKKEDVIENMKNMFPVMLALVEENWDGLQARRQVLAALDNGESGGRLQ